MQRDHMELYRSPRERGKFERAMQQTWYFIEIKQSYAKLEYQIISMNGEFIRESSINCVKVNLKVTSNNFI